MDEETLDEILAGRLRVFQRKRGYRFSLDAVLLAHFVALKSKGRAIDLGTGSGVIPMILAGRFPKVSWTGLEIQKRLAELAQKSVEFNKLHDRVDIVTGDARKIRDIFPEHSFVAVTFNPPYRKVNSGKINPDRERAIARHEIEGSLQEFLKAARYLVKPSGSVFTIYPAEKLARLIYLFRSSSIEPKRLKFVFSDSRSEAVFVLAEGRPGAREELKIETPLFIYGEDKKYSRQTISIFSDLAGAASSGGG